MVFSLRSACLRYGSGHGQCLFGQKDGLSRFAIAAYSVAVGVDHSSGFCSGDVWDVYLLRIQARDLLATNRLLSVCVERFAAWSGLDDVGYGGVF